MTLRRSRPLSSILALVALAVAAPAFSQSYGVGDQVLTVGALEFRPVFNSTPYSYSGIAGYLSTDNATFRAPLALPEGAEIFQICLYANIPDSMSYVDVTLTAMKLVPGGQSPGLVLIPGGYALDDIAIGYGTVCSDPFSYVFRQTADVDGDQTTEHVAHYLQSHINAGGLGGGGLGGVRIFWRRQVSPAPATATFNDVPTSDPAFQNIEALVASGITAGCGGANYCPNASLTRRQMAVFLSKALGLHWAD